MFMDDTAVSAGLLLIRLALGLMLIAHGTNKIFGAGGISGTARWFEALGLRPGILHAWAAAMTEIGAGVLMCVGLLLPATCAAFVGLMTVAGLTDHRGKGFFVFKGGWEYVGLTGVIAGALAFVGPGQWSIDHLIRLRLSGLNWGLAAVLVGLIAGAGMVLTFHRPTEQTT
jgi:putative oxidoreductase